MRRHYRRSPNRPIVGECYQIKDPEEIKKAYGLILETTEAFKEFMDDDFLKENKVVGYYRIKPTTIKYVNFFQDEKFQKQECKYLALRAKKARNQEFDFL